jgi:hypothetical protein
MWKYINSPIVIVILAISALFVFAGTMKPRLANEIRAAYEELNKIIENGASDVEKTKAIQQFAKEVATQMHNGFSDGLKSNTPQKENKDKIFVDTKSKLIISGIKKVKSEWQNGEKVIYSLKNESDKPISNLRVNFEYYKNGELIDCTNDWVSEVKILSPNETIALSHNRQLPKDPNGALNSDEVKISVTSFDVKFDDLN